MNVPIFLSEREKLWPRSVGRRRLILDSPRPSSLIFHIIWSALILLAFPTRRAVRRAAAGCVCRQGGLCVQAPPVWTVCTSSNMSEESSYFLIFFKKTESGPLHWFWTTRSNSSFWQGLIRVLLHTSAHRGCFCTRTNPRAQHFPGKSAAANVMTHPITFHKFCPLLSQQRARGTF